MKQLFIFTASRPDALKHYERTIKNPITESKLQEYLPPNKIDELKERSTKDQIYAWGVKPTDRSIRLWRKMKIGDIVVGYSRKRLICKSRIIGKRRAPNLAKDLWGVGKTPDDRGMTWEYMYFLNEIQELDVKSPIVFRGHTRPKKDNTYKILELIDEHEEARSLEDEISDETLRNYISKKIESGNYEAENKWSKRKKRTGQEVYREYVLENFGNQCCICGLNVDGLLEASHIKPWSEDKKNRLNPMNGLALCCLHHGAWEKRLLKIGKDRIIRVNPKLRKSSNETVRNYLAKFHGKRIKMPKQNDLLL